MKDTDELPPSQQEQTGAPVRKENEGVGRFWSVLWRGFVLPLIFGVAGTVLADRVTALLMTRTLSRTIFSLRHELTFGAVLAVMIAVFLLYSRRKMLKSVGRDNDAVVRRRAEALALDIVAREEKLESDRLESTRERKEELARILVPLGELLSHSHMHSFPNVYRDIQMSQTNGEQGGAHPAKCFREDFSSSFQSIATRLHYLRQHLMVREAPLEGLCAEAVSVIVELRQVVERLYSEIRDKQIGVTRWSDQSKRSYNNLKERYNTILHSLNDFLDRQSMKDRRFDEYMLDSGALMETTTEKSG